MACTNSSYVEKTRPTPRRSATVSWYAQTVQAGFLAPGFLFLKVQSPLRFLKSRVKKHFRFLLIKLAVTPRVVLKSKPEPLLNPLNYAVYYLNKY